MYRFFLSVAVVAALAVAVGVWLDGYLRESRRRGDAEFELRVERELDKTVSLAGIVEGKKPTTLEVLRHLAGQVDLPIVVNRKALSDYVLLSRDECHLPPVSVSLRSMLGMLSRQIPLDYYVADRRLVLTSRRDAEDKMTTRVYPLPQLAGLEQVFDTDPDDLLDALLVAVAPDSWDDVGGAAIVEAVPGALVIRQTRRAHDRIQEFFRRLENDSPSPDAEGDYLSSFSPEERRIHVALQVPCDFQCTAEPLEKVMQRISAEHHIPIVIRQLKLWEESAQFAMPRLTLTMKQASLGAILRTLLEQERLAYVICDDMLQVTTSGDAEGNGKAVVFDVRDLMGTHGAADLDDLIQLIPQIVQPDGWNDRSGPGPIHDIQPGWLVLSETDQIHRETADLLTKIRAVLRRRSGEVPPAGTPTLAERNIAVALAKHIKLDYRDIPLREVVEDLAKKTGVNIRLDRRLTAERAADEEVPVVCELPPLPLQTALDRLLKCHALSGYELAWSIRDESLVLTTRDSDIFRHDLAILDVHDLTEPAEDDNAISAETLEHIVATIARPRDETERLATFRSLLVCSSPRRVNDDVQNLVQALRKYRDDALLGRPQGVSPITMPSSDVVLARIYPVHDLLNATASAAIVELQHAIQGMVMHETWADVGGPRHMIPFPPAGLLVSQNEKGHDQVEKFLDELRKHIVPGHHPAPWLVSRDNARKELEKALGSRANVLANVRRMKELRTAVERATEKDVALGLFYLVRELEKIPEPEATVAGPSPTVKQQLASRGLAVVDTDRGLKLMNVTDDIRLGFFDVRQLLSRENLLDEDEIRTLLDSPFSPEVRNSEQANFPVRFRDWIVLRSFEQRLGQLAEMIDWLKQHPEAPRALEVRARRDAKETVQLMRRLLDSKSAAEQLYLAFVLQFTVPPEDGLEELAMRVEKLPRQNDLLLAIRLKESLNRWVSVLPNDRVEAIFAASHSRILRLAAMQTLSSRLSLRDPVSKDLEIKTQKMIDARAADDEVSPDEATELRAALAAHGSPPVQRTDFEGKDRDDPRLLRNTNPRPWKPLRGRTQEMELNDPFEDGR